MHISSLIHAAYYVHQSNLDEEQISKKTSLPTDVAADDHFPSQYIGE